MTILEKFWLVYPNYRIVEVYCADADVEILDEEQTLSGYDVLPGTHPIAPVMLYDAALAGRVADELLQRGVYVIGFSYPVVPQGKARIRCQMSAAHTREDLEFAIEQFRAVGVASGLM